MFFLKELQYPVKMAGNVAVLGNEALGVKKVDIKDYSANLNIFDYILEKSKIYELSEHEASALYNTLRTA